MNIVVANNLQPFVRGGAELLAERLVLELQRAGHQVDLVRLPLGVDPDEMLDATIAASLWDLRIVDRVIGLKFPAYLIPHHDMVIWLVHQLRQAYEPPPVGWPPDPSLQPLIDVVRRADVRAFADASSVHAISPVVADRLRDSCGVEAAVLLTPPHTDHRFRSQPPEPFIVALGRISDGKRQHVAVEAMRHARPGFRLVVAGAADDPSVSDALERQITEAGLEDRVELIARYITDDEKLDLLARCSASVYLPVEEDSYGYVCYEAAMSAKPSITGTDSGGTHTLVRHERTGLVVDVVPESLAESFDRLAGDRDLSRDMGLAARRAAEELDLSWTKVVTDLTR